MEYYIASLIIVVVPAIIVVLFPHILWHKISDNILLATSLLWITNFIGIILVTEVKITILSYVLYILYGCWGLLLTWSICNILIKGMG